MGNPAIKVKRYNSDADYQKDANRMLKEGYVITGSTSEQPRSGCLRILTLGILFKPKPQFVVTYQRQEDKTN